MAKRVHKFWRLALGSLITLLGFAACKTAKKAQQDEERVVLYGPPPATIIGRQEPVDRIRALYGVPPIKVERAPMSQ